MGNLWIFLVLSVTIGAYAYSPIELKAEPITKASDVGYRLPKNFLPDSYTLRLTPDFDTFTFKGTVDIVFNVQNAVTNLTLHSKYLKIINSKLGTTTLPPPSFDTTYDFLTYTIPTSAIGTKLTLSIDYEGTLQNDMTGFYKSYYYEGGSKIWMATTQFQPVHARKAFPCFDEPGFKATFDVHMTCPTGYNCVSNMRRRANSTGNEYHFETTPRMSTYLLAFIVSKYQPANTTSDGKFSILARPEAKDMGYFSFDIGTKLTDKMGEYFNKPYYTMGAPNMKLDQVAIPDFSAGAMENWGLVTYREASLMYHPAESTVMSRQRIGAVLAHEIAHMWFGNHMTCHWWSDTWLNEAFARFFQHFITEEIESFGMNEQFIIAQVHASMLVDTSSTSTPLSNKDTNSPAEISNQFGTITYNKGASILRMIELLMGKDAFRDGLRELVSTRALEVVEPPHLYAALQGKNTAVTEMTIGDIMKPWVELPGFPVLYVKITPSTGIVALSQERFGKANQGSTNLYNIPISYVKEADSNANVNPTVTKIMKNRTDTITIPSVGSGFVLFNVKQHGYYRVHYDDNLYKALIKALNGEARTKIPEISRAQIVDDAFNFAREEYMKYSEALDIIKFLEFEDEYTPWAAGYAGINYMRLHFGKVPAISSKLDSFIRDKLMKKVVDKLGMDDRGTTNLEKIFRSNTMNLACNLGHPACISRSQTLFKNLKENNVIVPANLREFIYCTALRHGDHSNFDFLWQKYQKENVVNEQILILGALGCYGGHGAVTDYLSKLLHVESDIRDQDRMTAFNSALNGNPNNVNDVIMFVKNNLNSMKTVFGSNIMTAFSNIFTRCTTRAQINDFKSFLDSSIYLSQGQKDSVASMAQSAESMMTWAESKSADIEAWLKANGSSQLMAPLALILAMLFSIFIRH